MAARGDHTRAENEFRDLLPHLERKLSPDHPDTLATRFSIAQEMAARGDQRGGRGRFPWCACPTWSGSSVRTTRTR